MYRFLSEKFLKITCSSDLLHICLGLYTCQVMQYNEAVLTKCNIALLFWGRPIAEWRNPRDNKSLRRVSSSLPDCTTLPLCATCKDKANR